MSDLLCGHKLLQRSASEPEPQAVRRWPALHPIREHHLRVPRQPLPCAASAKDNTPVCMHPVQLCARELDRRCVSLHPRSF